MIHLCTHLLFMKEFTTETTGRQDPIYKKVIQILGLTGLILAGQEVVGIGADVAISQATEQNRSAVIQLLDIQPVDTTNNQAEASAPLADDAIMVAQID